VDVLAGRLPRQRFKVFANLPFTITSEIIAKLTTPPYRAADMYLVVQREAAARFTGMPAGTLRSTLLRPWFEPTVVHRFQRTDFVPAPEVDVVMLRLRKRGPPPAVGAHPYLYRDFVTMCFVSRRPILRDTLNQLMGRADANRALRHAGLNLDATPREVSFEAWIDLFEMFLVLGTPAGGRAVQSAHRELQIQQRSLAKVHRTRSRWRSAEPTGSSVS
jgi:23S rRNA (adenine-N6)-dimethyltransferase